MEENIISQIAKKRGVTPEHVRQEINTVINEMWTGGLISTMFTEKPTPEKFIEIFAFAFLQQHPK
jgi:hypothetical protein